MIAAARLVLIALTRFLVGGHGRWVGSEPTFEQRIYFANHGSHLDTIVLWAALPDALRARTSPVAARDYWGKGRLRRFVALDILDCVLVERQAPAGSDPLAPLRAALADGRSLILFPEGTRGEGSSIMPFKSGLYNLANTHPGVQLIPVFLDNLARAFPKGAYVPAPISCAARFGAPLRLRQGEERQAFLERAREAVAALGRPGEV
ncbi:lysophospholipid acyltransferase family protein [Jiella sonneratiae]|uniref:1-acyl-sn-glycerol-3-phosphate acyltransferase n=1 Tax=Jiella sonneratiae TaxID=2816856 RepID=A0ABS3J3J4_9HYPH|nr:lysophospholipid acyltransferase family protein [Jiella sonneratiae]MBO0904243.1 1-acyl-sn-glycerol-3-phosphate acyltransferase [Jiella sonneratiae]